MTVIVRGPDADRHANLLIHLAVEGTQDPPLIGPPGTRSCPDPLDDSAPPARTAKEANLASAEDYQRAPCVAVGRRNAIASATDFEEGETQPKNY